MAAEDRGVSDINVVVLGDKGVGKSGKSVSRAPSSAGRRRGYCMPDPLLDCLPSLVCGL